MVTISPLYNKIEVIFRLRLLETFVDCAFAGLRTNFWQELIELQAAIYRLDSHFEHNKEIADWFTGQCWMEIDSRVVDLSGGKSDAGFARDIHSYEKIERSLRGHWRESLPNLESYYYFKTCDVRLCRKLILAQDKAKMTQADRRAWELLDLIGEIFDDLADFHEDLDTLNGNRFALNVLAQGARATARAYRELVERINNRAQRVEMADTGRLKSSGMLTALFGCIELVSRLLNALTIDEAMLDRLVGTSMLLTLGGAKCLAISAPSNSEIERFLHNAA